MKRGLLILLLIVFSVSQMSAQRRVAVDTANYMRNSICLILMDGGAFDKSELIKQSFTSLPVPEKYNDHNIYERVYNTGDIEVTEEDMSALNKVKSDGMEAAAAAGEQPKKKKGGLGKFMGGLVKGVASGTTGGLVGGGVDKEEYAAIANKLILENKMAKQLADIWFLDSAGHVSEQLIFERGLYSFSAEKIEEAKETVAGVANQAKDSGFELLNSTFIIASHFSYLPKDSVVAEMAATATAVGAMFGTDVSGYAALAGTGAAMALGDGYFVKITSYLFKLKWNEEIQTVMFENLWNDSTAYANTDLFSCQYIGTEKAFANVKASIFKEKPEEELVHMATVNAVDAVLAKLEKKYDVFKTKTPLHVSVGPDGKPVYTAKVGLKEGLEGGDKYEVLEQVYNQETGRSTYKRVGELKVSKHQIWDNRFGADEEMALKGETQKFNETLFEGNIKDAQPGMLLRQIK